MANKRPESSDAWVGYSLDAVARTAEGGMRMFKVIYRGGCIPNVGDVYSVRFGENGTTYFLMYVDGEWSWVDSYWAEPLEE